MAYVIDVYNGSGVENSPSQAAGSVKRAAIAAARNVARRKWGRVMRVYPAEDCLAAFGPADGEQYVTVCATIAQD